LIEGIENTNTIDTKDNQLKTQIKDIKRIKTIDIEPTTN
jgi:hypothetical protein